MQVLLLVHRFPPGSLGGTELYTLHLARFLHARGHRVTVWTYTPGQTAEVVAQADEYEGLPVQRLAFDLDQTENPIREEYDNARVAAYARRALAEQRPDVLHVTHFGYLSTAPLAVAQALGIPTVVTLTDLWVLCPAGLLLRHDGSLCPGPRSVAECVRCYAHMGPRGARYAALSRRIPAPLWTMAARLAGAPLLRGARYARWLTALRLRTDVIRGRLLRAQALLCPGQFTRRMLTQNDYPGEALTLAPHGIVNPGALRRTTPVAGEAALRLGYIGPLARHKGAHLPLQALAQLGPETPVTLTYWGAPPSSDDAYGQALLEQIAATPGAAHRGPYANAQVHEILESLDVLVMPSLCYENTPTILYEAFASGTPVIASDQGGMHELVRTYQGGWLFPRGDAQALAALIRRLAGEREAVRRAASASLPVPDFATHAEQVERTYRRALEQKDRR